MLQVFEWGNFRLILNLRCPKNEKKGKLLFSFFYFLFFLTKKETKNSGKKECFAKQGRDRLAFFPGQRTKTLIG